jgi:hypothetical protein
MLPALLKGGLGASQLIGGLGGMLTTKRPQYKIPKAATMAMGVAQENANRMEMPGESTMYAKVAQQGANALGAAREYGQAGLAALPAIMAGMQGGNLNIGMQTSAWRDKKQGELMAALGQYAEYQDQEWQMNKFAPFMDKTRRSQNAIGAGIENISGGADSALMTMIGMPDLFGAKASPAQAVGGGSGQSFLTKGIGNAASAWKNFMTYKDYTPEYPGAISKM